MIYLQYEIDGLEGLCNQLMAVFRTIGEALYYTNKGESVCIILNDVQTRTSVNFDTHPYFENIKIDSYIDVNYLTQLLKSKNIEVKCIKKDINLSSQDKFISCRRFPHREIILDENKNLGLFIAKSFPFSKHIIKLSSFIIGLMSFYPKWKAIHLRIEKDLTHIPNFDLDMFTQNQFEEIIKSVVNTKNLSAVYIASGVQDSEHNIFINKLKEKSPNLVILNKKELFNNYSDIQKEFDALCLEEQALIDWLVCIGAPLFTGPHASSFSYLAGYMRHYRGFTKETTNLFPDYQRYWDIWFPCV